MIKFTLTPRNDRCARNHNYIYSTYTQLVPIPFRHLFPKEKAITRDNVDVLIFLSLSARMEATLDEKVRSIWVHINDSICTYICM
jgi:hypothetical protein